MDFLDDECCQVCDQGDDEDKLLICDSCSLMYHTYCLEVPLDEIPEGEWYCDNCAFIHRSLPHQNNNESLSSSSTSTRTIPNRIDTTLETRDSSNSMREITTRRTANQPTSTTIPIISGEVKHLSDLSKSQKRRTYALEKFAGRTLRPHQITPRQHQLQILSRLRAQRVRDDEKKEELNEIEEHEKKSKKRKKKNIPELYYESLSNFGNQKVQQRLEEISKSSKKQKGISKDIIEPKQSFLEKKKLKKDRQLSKIMNNPSSEADLFEILKHTSPRMDEIRKKKKFEREIPIDSFAPPPSNPFSNTKTDLRALRIQELLTEKNQIKEDFQSSPSPSPSHSNNLFSPSLSTQQQPNHEVINSDQQNLANIADEVKKQLSLYYNQKKLSKEQFKILAKKITHEIVELKLPLSSRDCKLKEIVNREINKLEKILF